MKKILLILFVLNTFITYSQNCINFEGSTSTSNWHLINVSSIQIHSNPNDQINSTNILSLTDGQDGSVAINNSDFSGNWIELAQEGCLCFDYKADYNPSEGLTAPGNILKVHLYTGPAITNNLNSFLNATRAIYKANSNQPTLPDNVWKKYCLPIGLSSNGQLPTDGNGYWVILQNEIELTGNQACTVWDNLIQNVTGLALATDYNGQPSEIINFDNFCWQCTQECVDFEENSTTSNWHLINVSSIQIHSNPNDQINSTNILSLTDGQDGSVAINNSDFSGNWIELAQEGCLCFDYKADYNPDIPLTPPGNILKVHLYTGPAITNNLNSFLNATRAIYKANSNQPTLPDNVWKKYCLPIGLSSNGQLPTDGNGYWVILQNEIELTGNQACTVWDNLIQNVTGLALATDYNGQPSEIINFDNFCWRCDEEPDTINLCCQIPNFNATLSGNNLNNLTLNLNSGTSQIQEVEVSLVDYHAIYSEPGCQPVNMDASGGHIGYMTTTTSNLAALSLVSSQNNSHVLDWLPGSPAQLNHTVNLSVKPPSLINVSCCSVDFWFCIKVRAKDVNCNVCEIDTCLKFTIGDTTAHESCCCERWSREQIAVHLATGSVGKSILHQVNCGGNITLPPGEYTVTAPAFICNPATCNTSYTWELNANFFRNSIKGNSNTLNFNFALPGNYVVAFTPQCGSCKCTPCTIFITIKGSGNDCICGKWKLPKIQLTSKPFQISKLVNCQTSVILESTGYYNLTSSEFVCSPDKCSALYKWSVAGPVSGSGDGNSFGFDYSVPGQYTVTFTPYCGSYDVKCEPCMITLIIKPGSSGKCECDGWITHKVSISWKIPDVHSAMMDCPSDPAFPIESVCEGSTVEGNFCVFACNPKKCKVFYNWQVYDPDGLIAGQGENSPNTHYEFTASKKGIYTLWIQPVCEGDVTCDNVCAIDINIMQIKRCN